MIICMNIYIIIYTLYDRMFKCSVCMIETFFAHKPATYPSCHFPYRMFGLKVTFEKTMALCFKKKSGP